MIDWNKVITQTVATVVGVVVVGAAVQMWLGYRSMDDKIAGAVATVAENQARILDAQDVLGPKVDKLERKLIEVTRSVNDLANQLKKPREQRSTVRRPEVPKTSERTAQEMLRLRRERRRPRR